MIRLSKVTMCYGLNGTRVLLDCGLYQGSRKEAEYRNRTFLHDPRQHVEVRGVGVRHPARVQHGGDHPPQAAHPRYQSGEDPRTAVPMPTPPEVPLSTMMSVATRATSVRRAKKRLIVWTVPMLRSSELW